MSVNGLLPLPSGQPWLFRTVLSTLNRLIAVGLPIGLRVRIRFLDVDLVWDEHNRSERGGRNIASVMRYRIKILILRPFRSYWRCWSVVPLAAVAPVNEHEEMSHASATTTTAAPAAHAPGSP